MWFLLGTTVYINDPERLHITAFYLSHVDDPRPEPYRQDGGQGSGPSASTLHQEAQKLQATTGAFPAFHLQVCSAATAGVVCACAMQTYVYQSAYSLVLSLGSMHLARWKPCAGSFFQGG